MENLFDRSLPRLPREIWDKINSQIVVSSRPVFITAPFTADCIQAFKATCPDPHFAEAYERDIPNQCPSFAVRDLARPSELHVWPTSYQTRLLLALASKRGPEAYTSIAELFFKRNRFGLLLPPFFTHELALVTNTSLNYRQWMNWWIEKAHRDHLERLETWLRDVHPAAKEIREMDVLVQPNMLSITRQNTFAHLELITPRLRAMFPNLRSGSGRYLTLLLVMAAYPCDQSCPSNAPPEKPGGKQSVYKIAFEYFPERRHRALIRERSEELRRAIDHLGRRIGCGKPQCVLPAHAYLLERLPAPIEDMNNWPLRPNPWELDERLGPRYWWEMRLLGITRTISKEEWTDLLSLQDDVNVAVDHLGQIASQNLNIAVNYMTQEAAGRADAEKAPRVESTDDVLVAAATTPAADETLQRLRESVRVLFEMKQRQRNEIAAEKERNAQLKEYLNRERENDWRLCEERMKYLLAYQTCMQELRACLEGEV